MATQSGGPRGPRPPPELRDFALLDHVRLTDPDLAYFISRKQRERRADALEDVANCGQIYLEELPRRDPAHTGRLAKREQALWQAIQDAAAVWENRGRLTLDDVQRFREMKARADEREPPAAEAEPEDASERGVVLHMPRRED